MDYEELAIKSEYDNNSDFKEYVDKYCKKHHKPVEEALKDILIISYLNYLIENQK